MQRPTAAALLLFLILSLVFTYPLPLHMSDAVEDRQDALLNVWITAWDGRQLVNDPLHLFDANIFFPYRRTLAYSELLLGNALLALPITALTGNPVLGYNLALYLSFVLTGLGTYLLVRALTHSAGAGVVAGTILAYCAYRMTNLAQAQLLTTQWLPFALLGLIRLLDEPRPRHVAIFVTFFCLQSLSSFYYALLLALTVGLWVLWYALTEAASPRTTDAWAFLPQKAAHLAVAVFLCALVLVPFALPYFGVQQELGFERSLADNEPFSASLRQYLMVPPGSILHSRWLPSDPTPIAGGYPVDALFPGLVALALGIWGLICGRGRRRWFFGLLLLLSLVLSFGPRLYLRPGEPASLAWQLPYAWLYHIVPGFKALRAPARFDALVMLGLCVLAGYGLARLQARITRRGWRSGFVAAVVLLVAAESLAWPPAQAEPVPVGDDVPRVYRWLAQQPSPAPIIELPMAFTPLGPQLQYQYFSTYHWRPTPDGYSGFVPPEHGQIVYEMARFPSERAVRLLQALDVQTVIIHGAAYQQQPAAWEELEHALAQAQDLQLVQTFDQDRVYLVPQAFSDPAVLSVSGHLPAQAAVGQTYTAYAIATNHDTRSYALAPTDQLQPVVTWHGAGEPLHHTLNVDVPLVTSPDGGALVVPLAVPAPDQPGSYDLSIKASDGPLGAWALSGAVEIVDAQETPASLPVPARLEVRHLPQRAQPGGTWSVELAWHALGKIDAYYSTYVKLLDGEGNALAGWDGQPQDGEAPTLLWVPGSMIDDTVTLTLPEDMPPGDYQVEAGMYRAQDLVRCLTLDKEGQPVQRLLLGTVSVEP